MLKLELENLSLTVRALGGLKSGLENLSFTGLCCMVEDASSKRAPGGFGAWGGVLQEAPGGFGA